MKGIETAMVWKEVEMKGIVRNFEGGIDFSYFVPASLAYDLILVPDPATLVLASSIKGLVNKQYIHEFYTLLSLQGIQVRNRWPSCVEAQY